MKKTYSSNTSKIYCCCMLLLFICNATVFAQVKIGDNPNAIHPASILELESTSRTLVLSRVTDVQMQSISPLDGALVYNTDQQCVFYFDQSTWQNLCAQGTQSGTGATMIDNEDNTYTFTDRNGNETLISFQGGSSISGETGSLFFAGTDGSVTESNTELYWDNINNRLGIGKNVDLNYEIDVNGNIGATNLLLNNGNQDLAPLTIRGRGQDQRMISFQDENQGTTLYNINLRGAGLNFDNVNRPHQLFLSIFPAGNVGIGTAGPSETLDVNGTLRVRNLAAAQTTDNFVTVDANGVFHRSVTNSNSGKSTVNSSFRKAAKWNNGTNRSALNYGKTTAPLFVNEEFNDALYRVKNNSLVVQQSGRYQIQSNISLNGMQVTAAGGTATVSARFTVNGIPKGASIVATNNGSTKKAIISSIQLNEIIELKMGDVLKVILVSDAIDKTIYFNGNATSNFTITEFK